MKFTSTSWRRVVTGTAALALTAALAGWAGAQTGPGPEVRSGQGPGRHAGPMMPGDQRGPMGFGQMQFGALNLTDQQREQIRSIREQHRDEFQQLATQLRDARQALNAAVTANEFNEGAVRAAATKVGEAQTEMAVLRAKVHQQTWNVLTPEQREKAQSLKVEREQRMKDRRDRLQQRLKNRPGAPQL